MANSMYDKGREGFLDGSIDWDTDSIKAVACDATYTPNLATDQFLSDIASGARIATSANLASKTVAAGVADAADVTFSAVTAGKTLNRFVLYKDTGSAGTSRLICSIDTLNGGGAVSIATSGGDVTLIFDNGANKIFKL
jgi:hypothetical protein